MNKTVLIVEDEAKLRELIADYLDAEGLAWLEAANGDEAVAVFREASPDLVILDILMPGLDGYDVCEAIRKQSDVPVLFLTAKSEEEDELLGYDLGADDYMTKPFSPKLLAAKVKALLRRSETVRSEPPETEGACIVAGCLRIDVSGREVVLDGTPLSMSPKEFDLLRYFADHRNIVLSRDRILEHVWGYDYEGDSRTVDTHVKRLRQKLGARADWISTLRGNGYRFTVTP
ncbi:response regulator transcription factor [Paenibacillus sacheonensis]|uniref:Response regulator n=1 Tax=Paenibacillus sacheonensis TaxID=742054 RepID=A0A7X4YLN5_9BACL|nr:response regulator transcription factor [Paenibacillus sacheonensis]MBM7563981.1 DNA-binding response OmpR family regulator [Paenibacillus sacheonensis]NBC67679.1 response regulator [Paenibacillus sacheonensis]